MKKICLIAVLVMTFVSASALALPVIQTENYNFPLSPNQDTLTFNQFNMAGFTLTEVRLEIYTSISANVTCENDSQLPADIQLGMTGSAEATGGGLDVTASINYLSPVTSLTATDGVAGSGGDFHDFGLIEANDTKFDSLYLGIDDLTPFIGAGTIDILVDGLGGHAVTGTTDYNLEVSNFGADGYVEIQYIYTQVPEPATIMLVASSLVGIVGIARRKLKK